MRNFFISVIIFLSSSSVISTGLSGKCLNLEEGHFLHGNESYQLQSPDGKYVVEAGVNPSGQFQYSVSFNGRIIILPSTLNLEEGKYYSARIYSDDPSINTDTHVKIENRAINSKSILVFDLKPNNGLAIKISPKR